MQRAPWNLHRASLIPLLFFWHQVFHKSSNGNKASTVSRNLVGSAIFFFGFLYKKVLKVNSLLRISIILTSRCLGDDDDGEGNTSRKVSTAPSSSPEASNRMVPANWQRRMVRRCSRRWAMSLQSSECRWPRRNALGETCMPHSSQGR